MTHAFPGGLRQKDQLLAALEGYRQSGSLEPHNFRRSPLAAMCTELSGNPYCDSAWLADRIFGGVAEVAMLVNYVFNNLSSEFASIWPTAAVRHVEVGANLARVPYQVAIWSIQNAAHGFSQFLPNDPKAQTLVRECVQLLSGAEAGAPWDHSIRSAVRNRALDFRRSCFDGSHTEAAAADALFAAATACVDGMNERQLELLLDQALRAFTTPAETSEQAARRRGEFIRALSLKFLQALEAATAEPPSTEFVRATNNAA